MKNLKIYKHKGRIIAVVVKSGFRAAGNSFFTPEDFSQQLAFVSHRKGEAVNAHIHNRFKRVVYRTQEVDILRKGRIRVALYSDDKKYLESFVLKAGDIILFASGGHGYEVLEDMELVLVKQGPYAGNKDKTRIEIKNS